MTTFGQRLTAKLMSLEQKLAGLESKTAQLDGLALSYYDNNARGKPVLVLIHGYTADKTLWHRLAKRLGAQYHLIIPDMAGHGETSYDKGGDYSMPAQTAWLAKLLDHIGVAKAHIAGNSMGGFITASFAIAHPSKTQSAILIDPAGITSPQPSDIAIAYETGRNMFLPDTLAEFREFIAMVMAKPPFMPKFIINTMARAHVARKDRYAHIFHDFFDQDFLEDELDKLQAPTLLIWGEQDKILHVSAAPIWQDGIPNCETIIWKDLGHVAPLEAVKRTADAMHAFIEECGV